MFKFIQCSNIILLYNSENFYHDFYNYFMHSGCQELGLNLQFQIDCFQITCWCDVRAIKKTNVNIKMICLKKFHFFKTCLRRIG